MSKFVLLGLFLLAEYTAASIPCPGVFNPLKADKGRWDGELILQSDDDLHGIWVRVIFDKPIGKLEIIDNSGAEVQSRGEKGNEFLIKNPEFVLEAEAKKVIKFRVIYTGNEAPKLTAVRLNAKYICPDKSQSLQWSGSEAVNFEETEFQGDLHSADFLSQRPVVSVVEGCGTAPLRKHKKKDNDPNNKEGYWPWHVSLSATKNGKEAIICSGVLISGSHVLTAAHCVTQRKTRNVISSNLVNVRAGKYNLKGNNPEVEQRLLVAHIQIHPAYNPQTLDNNIAIVRLTRGYTMDDYVRPVCLWEESPDSESLVRKQGYVAGFAYNDKQQYSKQLTDSKMVVASSQDCAKSSTDLEEFLHPKVFCAGNAKGSSTCVGDSGSALVFPRPGAPDTYQLRGIVSVSYALQKQFVCDDSHFAVFTDVAKYLDWIRTSIS